MHIHTHITGESQKAYLAWKHMIAPNSPRQDSHYRNQFETKSSMGLLDHSVRNSWEGSLFGRAYEVEGVGAGSIGSDQFCPGCGSFPSAQIWCVERLERPLWHLRLCALVEASCNKTSANVWVMLNCFAGIRTCSIWTNGGLVEIPGAIGPRAFSIRLRKSQSNPAKPK